MTKSALFRTIPVLLALMILAPRSTAQGPVAPAAGALDAGPRQPAAHGALPSADDDLHDQDRDPQHDLIMEVMQATCGRLGPQHNVIFPGLLETYYPCSNDRPCYRYALHDESYTIPEFRAIILYAWHSADGLPELFEEMKRVEAAIGFLRDETTFHGYPALLIGNPLEDPVIGFYVLVGRFMIYAGCEGCSIGTLRPLAEALYVEGTARNLFVPGTSVITLRASATGYDDRTTSVENAGNLGTIAISGRVTDQVTGDPIAGATVQIIGGANAASTTTAPNGTYALTAVIPAGAGQGAVGDVDLALEPVRQVDLHASAAGYAGATTSVENSNNLGTITISGRVTDQVTGDPIAGATVEIIGGANAASTTTRPDGTYALTAVIPDGAGQGAVGGVDFALEPIEQYVLNLTASRQSVKADGVDAVDLLARITNAQGNGVADQTIQFSLDPVLGTLSATQGTTDANGEVSVRYTAPRAEDLSPDERGVTIRASSPQAGSDSVSIRLLTHALTLGVEPAFLPPDGQAQAAVTIEARDYFNNPAAGETIVFDTPAKGQLSQTTVTTGPDGRAQLTYTAPAPEELSGQPGEEVALQATNRSHYATASVKVGIEGLKPVIKEVRQTYKGFFLEDITVLNTYYVFVDWNGPAPENG